MPQPRARPAGGFRPNIRPDHNGTQRAQFESNKKKIYATQTHCGICGNPVDFGMKWPHPLIMLIYRNVCKQKSACMRHNNDTGGFCVWWRRSRGKFCHGL